MSVGVWALLVFGAFAAVSALEAFVLDRRDRSVAGDPSRPIGGVLGGAFNLVGGVLALFIASYTGVLLSVSNQPIWSDTWMLGGPFLASGLSASVQAVAARRSSPARAPTPWSCPSSSCLVCSRCVRR